MALKIRTSVTHYVDSEDLSNYIEQFYGQPYNFVPDQEAGNDSEHHFLVTGTLGPDEETSVKEFIAGEGYTFIAQALLDDLCRELLLEPGEYIVEVCW